MIGSYNAKDKKQIRLFNPTMRTGNHPYTMIRFDNGVLSTETMLACGYSSQWGMLLFTEEM